MKLRPDTLAMTATLALLTALGPLSTDMYLPSLPAIAKAFNADTASTQLTLSLFLAGFAVGQIFYGPLSDRYGRKPVLLAGFAMFLVATFLCSFAPSIEALTGRPCSLDAARAALVDALPAALRRRPFAPSAQT